MFHTLYEQLNLSSKLSGARQNYERRIKTRLDILNGQLSELCLQDCKNEWLSSAAEILNRNELMVSAFCGAIYKALKEGRGKYRNSFKHGPHTVVKCS